MDSSALLMVRAAMAKASYATLTLAAVTHTTRNHKDAKKAYTLSGRFSSLSENCEAHNTRNIKSSLRINVLNYAVVHKAQKLTCKYAHTMYKHCN